MGLEDIIDSAEKFIRKNKGFCIGTALLAGTCIADAYITSHFISVYGAETEMNVLVRYFIRAFGGAGTYIHKVVLAAPLLYISRKKEINWPLYAGSALCAFGALSWYIWP